MVPLCRDQGVGLIPWSPIARGRLARPAGTQTHRTADDSFGTVLYGSTEDADAKVINAVVEVAARLGRLWRRSRWHG
jgi:aryl-alcohol dehydrogenase-like predicted oxidoreductase